MNRVIIILLCVCSAVVCAFLAYLGYQAGIQGKADEEAPPEIRCSDLIKRVPANLFRLTLTEFRPGKNFVSYDDDENGEWERVVVPMFPVQQIKLTQNYRAAIVCFADVINEEQLNERIHADRLDADYWYASQSLDSRTYNQLAEHYNSMNFDRSVILYSGYPHNEGLYGNIMLWAGSGGAVLSAFVLGWQTICLMIAGIRRTASSSVADDDEEDVVITNRAGLPTTETDEFEI